ncbi:MAG: Flp pilus assembly protein CpaB [Bacteriovoracaceae bacterium]|nr:Flp pilus assembly protein CpaB [Bacteriovoracaceae bacterium]
MNRRAFTLSLVIAGIAMFMVYSYIKGKEAEYVKSYGQSVAVVVAQADVKELELLDDRKVMVVNVPEKFVQPGALRNISEIDNMYAAVPILKGEQITKTRVTHPGGRTGLASQVAVGKRAISIRVSDETAVAKLIKPGDRVDLVALIDYAGGKKDMIKVKTVLQDVLVLSTGLKVTNAIPLIAEKTDAGYQTRNLNSYTGFSTITLELTPFEVQKVIFLDSLGGNVRLSLRNNDDKTIERISVTKIFDVLGEDAPEAKSYFAEQNARTQGRR